jgi:hypothetical protein
MIHVRQRLAFKWALTHRLPVTTGKTSLDWASIILNATFFKSEMPTAMSSSIPTSSPKQRGTCLIIDYEKGNVTSYQTSYWNPF